MQASESPPRAQAIEAFVHELVNAWKRLSLYPDGHPVRSGVVERCSRLLGPAVGEASQLALGVSKNGLTTGEWKLQSQSSLDLAAVLYRQNVALIRIASGIALPGLERLLLLIGRTREPGADSLADRVTLAEIPGVEIEGVEYSALRLTADLEEPEEVVGRSSLWDRILRYKLAGLDVGGEGAPNLGRVLEAIRSWLGPEGFDTEGLGSGATTDKAREARAEAAQALMEAVEEQVLEAAMIGDLEGAKNEVRHLVQGLPSSLRQSVVNSLLSRSLQSGGSEELLETLFAVLARGDLLAALRILRDEGVRFSGDNLERLAAEVQRRSDLEQGGMSAPTAGAHDEDGLPPVSEHDDLFFLLPSNARGSLGPSGLESELESLSPGALLQSSMSVLLELLRSDLLESGYEALASRLGLLFADLVVTNRPRAALALFRHLVRLTDTEFPGRRHVFSLVGTLRGDRGVQILVEGIRAGVAGQGLDELIQELGVDSIRGVLVHLCETEDRSERRLIFDFAKKLGREISVPARLLLRDGRWFVVRNMLALIGEVGDRSAIVEIRHCTAHQDSRVRIEAIRALAALDRELPPEIFERLLQDPEPRVAEATMQSAGRHRCGTAVGPLLTLLMQGDLMGRRRAPRLSALRCLGAIGAPEALGYLSDFFATGLSTISSEERRAAYRSLGGYPREATVHLIQRGLASRDSEIRSACLAAQAPTGSHRSLRSPETPDPDFEDDRS